MASPFGTPSPFATTTSLSLDESNPNLHMPMILCCLCGTKIAPNRANMCVNCLKTQVDVTEGITKQVTIFFCRGCDRYQRPPWVACAHESRELLALCLKKVKGLNKDVKLIDAGFVWTEPHSRRIKIKLTIQKEVMGGLILQQSFVVEFVVTNLQCPDCQKSYTEHTWNTVVQVRQKVKHKRTFFMLEQLLLKHGVTDKAIGVKEQPDGLDFYWSSKSEAQHLLSFLKSVVPVRENASRRLISADLQSNISNYKHTLFAEIAPICRDDLCVLDPKLAAQLGGVSPLMLCHKVSSALHLIDPLSLKFVEVSGGTYFRHPFSALLTSRQLVEFVVLDVQRADRSAAKGDGFNKHGALRDKLALAEVTVARSSDLGSNDRTYECLTHLGNLLNPGDAVLGYDLDGANLSDHVLRPLRDRKLPEVILVRKTYPNRKNRAAKRNWRLKSLKKLPSDKPARKGDAEREAGDYEEFLQAVEEDPELRAGLTLYRKPGAPRGAGAEGKRAMDDDDDEKADDGFPLVSEAELVDDLAAVTFDDDAAPDDHKPIAFDQPAASASSPSPFATPLPP